MDQMDQEAGVTLLEYAAECASNPYMAPGDAIVVLMLQYPGLTRYGALRAITEATGAAMEDAD